MIELRFLRTDGDFIVLENSEGETFRVAIDEPVRRAARRDSAAPQSTGNLSPREIQDEVRSGTGIAELAAKTGASIDYIEKFAAPVLDELAHVVQTALSVRITVAGDRYSETAQVEFGSLILERLSASGYANVTWSSSKPEFGDWRVTCDLGDTHATWVFDLKKLSLSPDNELAVQLSATQSFADSPIPKLKAMPAQPANPQVPDTSAVPAAFAKPKNSQPENATGDLGDTLEFDGVIPFGRTKPAEPAEPTMGENLANTADLLDALRKKRLEREAIEAETQVVPELETEAEATQVIETPVAAEPVEPAEVESKPAKKGRAAVPSWNDIVFGTRPDSED